MRDLSSLRNRLLAAMGFVAAAGAAACESPKATPAATPTDAAAADTPASIDATANDTAAADAPVAVDTAGTPETVADAGPDAVVLDAVVPDAVVPVDAKPDTAPDATAETSAPDAVAETSPKDVADAGPPVPDVCKGGGIPATYTCFSATKLKHDIENPQQGGKVPPQADASSGPTYDGPLPPEGCPAPSLVKDGCCMPAVQPADLVGDTCCYWHCAKACCGRPLEVDGLHRVAGLVSGADWLGAADVEAPAAVGDLRPEHAAALAAAWRADAADEHASVASFQRFGMDLLALGAPPELVADAARAAADEVAHARLCFGVAARLDGRAIGPGRLDVSGIVARGDLVSAAVAAVREGCIGETLAAAQAAAAARGTSDPALAEAMSALADDEARHAELAWRFVAWACAENATVCGAVAAAFEAALAQGVAMDPREAVLAGVPDAARRRWGRLGAGVADRLARSVLAEVVAPCARRLVGRAEAGPAQGLATAAVS